MFPKNQMARRMLFAVLLFGTVCVIGVAGYMLLEPGWSLLDAAFMTLITLTTVGYSDYEVSQAGRLFTMGLLTLGIGSFTYALATVTTFVVDGHVRDAFRRKRMERQIAALSGHAIVCGLGNTGRYIVAEFRKAGMQFVVIESDAERIRELAESGPLLYIEGDATDDRNLELAGVERAQKLIASLSLDKDNLLLVLSARRLNAKLRIIAKVVDLKASAAKMKLVGANEVVSPEAIGGLRIASLALRPRVVGFLDLMLREGNTTRFEEAEVGAESRLAGKTIGDSKIRSDAGLLVVAVRKGVGGKMIYNPDGDLDIVAGDTLFFIGDPESVVKMRRLAGSPA